VPTIASCISQMTNAAWWRRVNIDPPQWRSSFGSTRGQMRSYESGFTAFPVAWRGILAAVEAGRLSAAW
jgi:hypothetical protein